MLEEFTVVTFEERLGETFRIVRDDDSALDVELVSASADTQPNQAPRGRAPFSIVFRGPLEPILPQRIYHFEHEALGSFDLFIVPIGPDESGMQYEAVFG